MASRMVDILKTLEANISGPVKESKTEEVQTSANQQKKSSKQGIMNALLRGMGKKSSATFVEKAKQMFLKMTDEDIARIIKYAKKLPIKKSNFESTYDENKTKGNTTLTGFGLAQADIDKTGPRKGLEKAHAELKDTLERCVWSVNPDANWSDIVRIPEIEEIILESWVMNQTVKPKALPLLFTRAYYMPATWKLIESEMNGRISQLEFLIPLYKNAFILSDTSFKGYKGEDVGLKTNTSPILAEVLKPENKLDNVILAQLTQKMMEDAPADVFANAICPQVIFAMQCKSLRMARNNDSGIVNHIQGQIVLLMYRIIAIHQDITGKAPPDFGDSVGLSNDDPFVRYYYKCYRVVHMIVRLSKRLVYGFVGGANTKAATELTRYDFKTVQKSASSVRISTAVWQNMKRGKDTLF